MLVLGAIYSFFRNGVHKIAHDKLCVEQKYVKHLAMILFLVNEPFTSLSLEISEKYGFISLISSCGFYSFVLYFWLVIYDVSSNYSLSLQILKYFYSAFQVLILLFRGY